MMADISRLHGLALYGAPAGGPRMGEFRAPGSAARLSRLRGRFAKGTVLHSFCMQFRRPPKEPWTSSQAHHTL